MKTGIPTIILIVVICSCTIDQDNNIPVARIDNKIIYQYEIDSFVNNHMDLINLNALYQLIDNRVIMLHSDNDRLKKTGTLSPFKTGIPNSEARIFSSQKLNRFSNSEDSLLSYIKNKHDIRIFLNLKSFDQSILNNLYGYNIQNSNANKKIYVLFDYCCPLCAIDDNQLRKVCKEYNVNLKYIYYSDFISIEALACDVANKYKKYWQMHDSIIGRACENNIDYVMQVANSIGIDTSRFNELVFDKKTIKYHEKNRSILDRLEIYGVPTYIYNNTIYNDIESIKLVFQAEN